MSSARTSYALIGCGGYIAPRHMKAIKAIGGDLVVAHDPNDSVGILDSYFPETRFFTEFERFDRHVDKLRRRGEKVDHFAICSPNYLHDAHVRFALRSDADAICEKPLVLNPWNIDGLAEIAESTGRRVNTILQLRLHPSIEQLRQDVMSGNEVYEVDLAYIASRGRWYHSSWKGDVSKSGGVATNIGVHFFDMLYHVFGDIRSNIVHLHDDQRAAGYLECNRARVRWFLSVDANDLPPWLPEGQRTYRSISVDGSGFEFSKGFEDLHTRSYEAIIEGCGFDLDDVRPSIEAVSAIRTAPVNASAGDCHPFTQRYLI